jgi:hypothetical protein
MFKQCDGQHFKWPVTLNHWMQKKKTLTWYADGNHVQILFHSVTVHNIWLTMWITCIIDSINNMDYM